MKKTIWYYLTLILMSVCISSGALADNAASSFQEAFQKGKFSGSLRSYYFSQTFEGAGKNDSGIWVNGGNLKYETASLYGLSLGANFQASTVTDKDDDDRRNAGDLDADGAVLSEAYLQYQISNTILKGGRQFVSLPLLSGSGSRLIKESFEAYMITNKDLPGTVVTAGWATKYGTRTDKSSYGDNPFVQFETNGDGDPGTFVDIGDDGMGFIYVKNSSLKDLAIQVQYADVFDEVSAVYADATYTFPVDLKPFIAAQCYVTDWDASARTDNDVLGFKAGLSIKDVSLFTAYTTASGSAGETRVFRGVGQGAYNIYTATTKSSGAPAYEAGTDAYQIGAAYKYKGFDAMLRYTAFDSPVANADLDEYTLNLSYAFDGMLKGFSLSADYSVLDYANNANDATDLRTRLIYSF